MYIYFLFYNFLKNKHYKSFSNFHFSFVVSTLKCQCFMVEDWGLPPLATAFEKQTLQPSSVFLYTLFCCLTLTPIHMHYHHSTQLYIYNSNLTSQSPEPKQAPFPFLFNTLFAFRIHYFSQSLILKVEPLLLCKPHSLTHTRSIQIRS